MNIRYNRIATKKRTEKEYNKTKAFFQLVKLHNFYGLL